MDPKLPEISKKKPPFFKVLNIFFFICLLLIIGYYALSAPLLNPSVSNRQIVVIHVAPNETLNSISQELKDKKIVRNAQVMKSLTVLFKAGRPIAKGDYLFDQNLPVWSVAWRLARSEHHIDPIKVTFPEGSTTNQMADILAEKLSAFRRDLFTSNPKVKQGYLFPDTYFFFSLATTEEIVSELTNTFNKKIAPYKIEIDKENKNLREIMIMASIIQKEAKDENDASTIAGILWKRIALGMLLQADAAPETYKTKGLSEEPINNPGLIAIDAAVNPKDSPYLYYLHDKAGLAHYAVTFAEHKKNISQYLK
jgi:UPF0755 protein